MTVKYVDIKLLIINLKVSMFSYAIYTKVGYINNEILNNNKPSISFKYYKLQ